MKNNLNLDLLTGCLQGRGKTAPRVAAVLLFAVFTLSLAIIPLNKVSAVSTATPPTDCNIDYRGVLDNADWQTDASTTAGLSNGIKRVAANAFGSYWKGANFSYVMGLQSNATYSNGDGSSGTYILKQSIYVADTAGQTFEWVKDSSGYFLKTPAGGYKVTQLFVYVMPDLTLIPMTENHTSTFVATVQNLPISCVSYTENVKYSASWDGKAYFTGTPNGISKVICAPTDIVCKMKEVWGGVTETFSDVGKRIVDGIAAIFIPDSMVLTEYFNEYNDTLQTKLGFLTFPFTMLVDIFNAIGNDAAWCSTSSCTKNFGSLYGSDLVVDFATFSRDYTTQYNILVMMIRAVTLISLVFALKNKLKEVMSR